jgi:hypothetical protein
MMVDRAIRQRAAVVDGTAQNPLTPTAFSCVPPAVDAAESLLSANPFGLPKTGQLKVLET